MTIPPNLQQRVVYYSGLVQGVGFRYTTRGIANRYNVAGFVQNLSDGRVYLAVEGEKDEIDRFLLELATEMSSCIRNCEIQDIKATGEFDKFVIQH